MSVNRLNLFVSSVLILLSISSCDVFDSSKYIEYDFSYSYNSSSNVVDSSSIDDLKIHLFVNSQEIDLNSEIYDVDNVYFVDVFDVSSHLNISAEVIDNVCCVTSLNTIVWFDATLNQATIVDINNPDNSTTHTLEKNPIKTETSFDVPLKDLGIILGYQVSVTDRIISFSK